MYNIFSLPNDFLDRDYTDEEKEKFNHAIGEAIAGRSVLAEELSDLTNQQKKKVDSWDWQDRTVKREHDRVFGQGNDRIVIPLDRSNEERIHSYNIKSLHRGWNGGDHYQSFRDSLNTMLSHHGYEIHDYVKGLAVKHEDKTNWSNSHDDNGNPTRPLRTVKIGKLLGSLKVGKYGSPPTPEDDPSTISNMGERATGVMSKGKRLPDGSREAPKNMNVNDAFNSDPIRAAQGDHVMVVTRNKYDVAGMSTNQGWSSCMNMVDGCNRRFLQHDIQNGTLTAYLAHKNFDEKGVRPIARVNAKRFDSDDGQHTTFVPESSHYGTAHSTFKNAVKEFFDKNYPLQNKDYTKHQSLYNDDGKSSIFKRDYSTLDYKDAKEAIHNLAAQHVRAADGVWENQKPHDDDDVYDRYDQHIRDGITSVDKKLRQMKPEHALGIGLNALTGHEEDFGRSRYGRRQSIWDIDKGDHNSTHIIGDAFGQMEHRKMLGAVSDDHITDLLHKAHDSIALNSNYEEMKASKEFHGNLIDEANSRINRDSTGEGRSSDKIRTTLHDLVHQEPEYYKHLEDETGTEVFHEHPVYSTTNPRRIEKHLYDSSLAGMNNVPKLDDMSDKDISRISEHVGKHADKKLANEFHTQQYHDIDHDAFVKGLNQNPNGERLQHHFIGRFYQDDHEIEAPDGNPYITKKKVEVSSPSHPNYFSTDRVPDASTPKHAFRDRHYAIKAVGVQPTDTKVIQDGTMFHAIARNSVHDSVLDHLANRQDVPETVRQAAKTRLADPRRVEERAGIVGDHIRENFREWIEDEFYSTINTTTHMEKNMAIDIKSIVEDRVDEKLLNHIEEGAVGNALDYLASSAQDSLQRKFLTHLSTHLKGLLDPDYKFYKGPKKEVEKKEGTNVGSESIRESEGSTQKIEAWHGTTAKFDEFKPNSYFTAHQDHAEQYARNQADAGKGDPRIYKVTLHLKNPKVVDQNYIEWAGYDENEVKKHRDAGYDAIMNDSKSEIVAFDPFSVEVHHGRPITHLRESAPAAYETALRKTVDAVRASQGNPKTFFDLFGSVWDEVYHSQHTDPDSEDENYEDHGQRIKYATDTGEVSEAKKGKKKKPVEAPQGTQILINPDKSEI